MEEEKAREEAEARRQRILDSANNRMDRVSGLNREEEVKASGSSKLAAMRRRRFKKKEPVEAVESEESKPETGIKEKASPVDEDTAPAEEPVVVVANAAAPKIAAAAVVEEEPADKPQRKYQGVAKMRRRMLKEKEEEQTATSGTADHDKEFVPRRKKKLHASSIPIWMHAFTVLLLFIAGLDVGLQQAPGDFAVVHTDYAPQQYGFRLLQVFGKQSSSTTEASKENLLKDTQEKWKENLQHQVQEEEFDSDEMPFVQKNIDPLFRVDLDQLTEGPGIFMMIGRFAVAVHRLILRIVYYMPLNMIKGMYNLILSMVETPPILCLAALTLRQLVGNTILGAKLPEKLVEEQKDIMTMVKKFVAGFIQNIFPTGVSMYNAWTHLRSDMYIVMFGMLVGLALTHSTPLRDMADAVTDTVEHVAETVAETFETIQDKVESIKEGMKEHATAGLAEEL